MSPPDRALAIVGGTFGFIGLMAFVLIYWSSRLTKKIERLRREQQQKS
ncbi:MAG: hypothetical protein ACYDCL_01045 [Myxococcales bacterium]